MTNSKTTLVDVYFNRKGRYLGYAGHFGMRPRVVQMEFENFEKFLELPEDARFLGRALRFGMEITDVNRD